MNKMDEQILVIKRSDLFDFTDTDDLAFQGFTNEEVLNDRLVRRLGEHVTSMRRGDAEENVAYKQPITYAMIRRDGKIFCYKRLSGGGETRLHAKLSVGIGGHMNAVPGASFDEAVWDNLTRELNEELDIEIDGAKLTFAGFLNDDKFIQETDEIGEPAGQEILDPTYVGNVHIGVLVVVDLPPHNKVEVKEADQLEGGFVHIEELRDVPETFERLENWSQIVINTAK